MDTKEPMKFHFSTTGIRGNVSKHLTPNFCHYAARAIGRWAKRNGTTRPRAVIGRDYRYSSDVLMSSVISGLLYEGVEVTIIEKQIPTPALIRYTIDHLYDFSVIITGSHLPPEDNGIILVDGNGNYFRGILEFQESDLPNRWDEFGSLAFVRDFSTEYSEFLNSIAERIGLQKNKLKVLLDPIGGPMGKPFYELLQNYVAKVKAINIEPDPRIQARPSEPKLETLKSTLTQFQSGDFDLGIATDFDGDRVIFITKKGRVLTGDYIGAIISKYFWELDSKNTVVIPINTSALISDLAEKMGTKFQYCKVGAPKIIEQMRATDAIFGFEETGKYFFRDYCLYPDSAATTLFVFHILQKTGKNLDQLVEELPVYYQMKTKTPSLRTTSEQLMQILETEISELLELLKGDFEIAKIHNLDGLRIDFTDGSWILLRQSGTEDNLRVFSESKDAGIAKMLNEKGLEFIKKKQSQLKLL